MSRNAQRRISPALVLSLALLAAALICLAIVVIVKSTGGSNPFAGRSLYTYPDSPAAKAIAANPEYANDFDVLATTPAAIWLTPEDYSTDAVGGYVSGIAREATASGSIATFVVYGIPNRDCGSESRGGLDDASYPAWVAAIAEGVAETGSIVILEPDSLGLTVQCGNADARVEQMRSAAAAFDTTDAIVYLDGGHSDWLPVSQMADLLGRAGVGSVRGFATNVSNYNPTDRERAYGDELSAATGGSHYVIDTSRNGAGSNGEWCNPSGRRVGGAPALDSSGTAHDGDLWIKTVGESDGSCNGGPPAGQWWNDGALELLGRAAR